MQLNREDTERNASDQCKAHNILLRQQHLLFDQQADALATAQRQDFTQFETASTQFAEEFGWQSSIPRCQPTPERRTPDAKC